MNKFLAWSIVLAAAGFIVFVTLAGPHQVGH